MNEQMKELLTSDNLYSSIGSQFYSRYRFGTLTNYYEKEHELNKIFEGMEFLKKFKNFYLGKRCFVIGNGPSLNKQDLTLMKNEFTIGSNYLYHNYEKMGFLPTIFTIVNYLVAEQRIGEINSLNTIKIFPYFLNYCIKQDSNTTFINSHAIKGFPKDLLKNISWQSTVTFFNLQLAYWLGFSEVYLVGVDNSYVQPKSGNEGSMVEQDKDDPNHFSKSYFKGLQWQKADTEAMDDMYKHVKVAFTNDNRTVFNATHGGKLETFNRKSYEKLFTNNNKSVQPEEFTRRYKEKEAITNRILVSINPDLKDEFGHYLHYDNCIYNHLPINTNLITLGNKSLDYSLGRENKWIVSSFTNQSWDIGRHSKNPTQILFSKFKLELYNAILQLDSLGIDKVFYMYTGSFNHIKCIHQLIKEKNLNFKFHINLFWEHFNIDTLDENIKDIQEYMVNEQIEIYVDSDELNEEIYAKINVKFKIWTMFSITNFSQLNSTNNNYDINNLNILYPGNLRIEKGFDLTVNSSTLFVNDHILNKHNIYLRSVILKGTSKEAIKMASLINQDVNIITGILDEFTYAEMFLNANIVVIPYTVKEFKTRTSGVLADSIISQKPILTVKGTWMGNIVESLGNGLVFEDGNELDLIEKMKTLIKNYEYYFNKAQNARVNWLKENNVLNLIHIINN